MTKVIDLVKDNIIPTILIGLSVIMLIVFIILLIKRPKKKKGKKVEKIEVPSGIQRIEKLNYKKCKWCGGQVPKDDNICMNCGEIPG